MLSVAVEGCSVKSADDGKEALVENAIKNLEFSVAVVTSTVASVSVFSSVKAVFIAVLSVVTTVSVANNVNWFVDVLDDVGEDSALDVFVSWVDACVATDVTTDVVVS